MKYIKELYIDFKKLIELNFSDKNINFLFKYNLEEWMI